MNKPLNKVMAMTFCEKEAKQYCKYTQYLRIYKRAKKQLDSLHNAMCDLWVEREKLAQKIWREKGVNLHAFDDCKNLKTFIDKN